MKVFKPVCLMLVMAAISQVGLAADANRSCNMQGREIALRATEQLDAALDAEKRNQLADIAAAVCLQYQTELAHAQGLAASSEAAAAVAAEEKDRGMFSLKVIDPKDRVRRPGLKRR